MVSKALLKEAAELLPKMPHTDDIYEIKSFLVDNLPFNSETTRKRYEGYITIYLFPDGKVDREILNFALYASSQSIKNVCLYRFCKQYPLIYDIFNDLFIPKITSGSIPKKSIDQYLQDRFSNNNPGRFGGRGFIEALNGAEVMTYTNSILKYQYRPVDLPSYTFILHSEFPQPGMYDLKLIEQNQAFTPQLWRTTELVDTLYHMRNRDRMCLAQGFPMLMSEIYHVYFDIFTKL